MLPEECCLRNFFSWRLCFSRHPCRRRRKKKTNKLYLKKGSGNEAPGWSPGWSPLVRAPIDPCRSTQSKRAGFKENCVRRAFRFFSSGLSLSLCIFIHIIFILWLGSASSLIPDESLEREVTVNAPLQCVFLFVCLFSLCIFYFCGVARDRGRGFNAQPPSKVPQPPPSGLQVLSRLAAKMAMTRRTFDDGCVGCTPEVKTPLSLGT